MAIARLITATDILGLTPVPQGDNRVVIVGTSLIQHANRLGPSTGTITSFSNWARHWMTWLCFLEPRVRFETWIDEADTNGRRFTGANHGVSGQTCDQILARLSAVIAMKPTLVILDMGTNDVGTLTKETIHAKRVQACETLRAAGILVILLPILARGTETYAINASSTRVSWASGGTQRKQMHWINHQSAYYAAAAGGVACVDLNDGYVDPASLTGEPYAGYATTARTSSRQAHTPSPRCSWVPCGHSCRRHPPPSLPWTTSTMRPTIPLASCSATPSCRPVFRPPVRSARAPREAPPT